LTVTEPVPFKISVDEPRVPIVKRGSMELPVRVDRAPGFAGDVSLRMLWNPPGISSGQAVAHAAQPSIGVPLNASEVAMLGKWKIVVVATADIRGPVEVAAAPVMLEV